MKKKNVLKHPKRAPKRTRQKGRQAAGKKLDRILALEQNLLKEEKTIERRESLLQKEEKNVLSDDKGIKTEEKKEVQELKSLENEISKKENAEEDELSKLQKIEQDIKKQVGDHPLTHITLRDIIKGLVGAFVGLAVHYTFTYGVEIADKLTFLRATLLFPVTFIIGLMFIYATGFRKVKDPKLLIFMPARLLVLYVSAIVMSILVLFLFYPNFGQDFMESYKMVAGVLLAAVVGACTADLFGKE